jgi:hypothetical protein
MGKDTFLLVFVLGAAAIAVWIALRLPRLAPAGFRWATGHLAAALLVGTVLGPLLHAVPGLPAARSVLAALFLIALPALTYMFLVGLWIVQLASGSSLAPRR